MSNGPFYFAWVRPDQTTFDELTMLVEDEDIFDFSIKHDEGQFATLTLTVKNPRVGLLSAGRNLWAWFACTESNGHVRPLFFGVLTSIPTDMFQELIELKFNARPQDYILAKQNAAEFLKVRPYYDPVFLDDKHRDDPDAILEGWSKLYHIDRITHEVTVSDILEGEDGTIEFDETKAFYDSVKMQLGEAPLNVVQVQAGVQWTQRYIDILAQPVNINISSYTGGSFKSDWPKPGSELGGGWKCEASYVTDVLGTEHAKATSNSATDENHDPDSEECSMESNSVSVTTCAVPGIAVDNHIEWQTGVCAPDFIGPDGSQGFNLPATVNSNGTLALMWHLNCTMFLRYEAKREFSEEVTINVVANVQHTVVSPLVDEHTEVMKVSGANVGQPLMSVNAWTNYKLQHVDITTLIMPNDRSQVGGTSYQICVQSGIAGGTEPIFSDTPGELTADGGVIWASLGDSPPSTQPSWTDSTAIPIGEIRLYEPKVFSDGSGTFETTGQSCYLLCIRGGTTTNTFVDFTYTPAATSNDDALPQPVNTAYIPGPGQVIPYAAPIFLPGEIVQDGGVTWIGLGTQPAFLGIPIGGTTEKVSARSYFARDRGHWSIEYLICKARARLRHRARCIKVSWSAAFEDCLDLSLRKNATVFDSRIPGGSATGKITSYELTGTRDGTLKGNVQIGVSVGFGNTVLDFDGTPEYTAATGYMAPGYQVYDGKRVSIVDGDISYTPPAFSPFDDGNAFPLQFFPGVIVMTTPDQVAAVEHAMAALDSNFVGANTPFLQSRDGSSTSLLGGGSPSKYVTEDVNPVQYALSASPVACEIIIKPVTNGPFNGGILVETSTLELPIGMNLSAGSTL